MAHSRSNGQQLFKPSLFPTVLFGLVMSTVAFGVGDNCSFNTACSGDLQASISCGAGSEVAGGSDCGLPFESVQKSLLRVAVQCFDENIVAQARYKDKHGGPSSGLNFADLVDGTVGEQCDDFIASAHFIGDDGSFAQAQCFRSDTNMVPNCEAPTPEEVATVKRSTRLYSAILATGGAESCFNNELNKVELRNSSLDYAYQGVMAGRYVCSQHDNLAAGIVPCDDGPGNPFDRPAVGAFGAVEGFNLAPQSQSVFKINPELGFNFCCDNDVPGDPSGGDCVVDMATQDCSPADIQCSNAAIFALCRDGEDACEDSDNFVALSPVIWLDPVLDVDPGDNPNVTPSAFAGACLNFDFESTIADEQETRNFTFGGAFRATDVCTLSTGAGADIDFDGNYDQCDPVLQETGPSDGFHTQSDSRTSCETKCSSLRPVSQCRMM